MLTGSLPFEGRTTAQLASQHLHSRPKLDRLPASDQPTIARSLVERSVAAVFQFERHDRIALGSDAQLSAAFTRVAARTQYLLFVRRRRKCLKTEVLYRSRELETTLAADSATPPRRAAEPAPAIRELPPLALDPNQVTLSADSLHRPGRAGGPNVASLAAAAGRPVW